MRESVRNREISVEQHRQKISYMSHSLRKSTEILCPYFINILAVFRRYGEVRFSLGLSLQLPSLRFLLILCHAFYTLQSSFSPLAGESRHAELESAILITMQG
jgi:uncharacterized membrane protein YqaE (UPF0057 family)